MTAIVLVQKFTPTEGAAAEKVTANSMGPESSDSGYASTENTPDSSTTGHSQDFVDGVAIPSRRLFERKVTKLRHFDKEIPQFTQHRFYDLHELFERPLCEFLIKANVKCNAISIKLRILGESEATAKPWIVILCEKAASKKIKQFFNQPQIKAEYHPPNPDSSRLSFEVFVCNRAPRPRAGTEVYGDCDERATMCGRIIKVGDTHHSRFATLGGVVKTVKPPGSVKLYGMTAGHIIAQQPLGKSSFDQIQFCDEEDEEEYEEDEGFYSGEEEFELDDSFEGDEEMQGFATTGDRTRTVAQGTQSGRLWPKIGCVSAASMEETGTEHDLDWALIDFDDPTDCRPNLLVPLNSEEGATSNRPLKESGKLPGDEASRSVLLLSGTGGVRRGMLSTSFSFLMMRPAKAFTKTYTLILPHGSVLNAGDCGTWVVELSTWEVYGHIVASDVMGDTYVVPLDATLRDMEKKLRAAVSLPTEADVHAWLAQHVSADAEQVTVPARSENKKFAFSDSKMDRAKSPREVQKLAKHSLSRVSKSPAPSTIKVSTSVRNYCIACNAKFEGTSYDVRSSFLHHLRTCPRPRKISPSEIERSFLKGGDKILSTSNTRDNRNAEIASSKMLAATASSMSTTDDLKRGLKRKSNYGITTAMNRWLYGRPTDFLWLVAQPQGPFTSFSPIPSSGGVQNSWVVVPRHIGTQAPDDGIPFELNLSAFQEPICVTYLVQNFHGLFDILPVLDADIVFGTAKDSVNALALAFYGRIHRQSKLIQQGSHCYAKALRKLAGDLDDRNVMWSSSVLLSSILLARYESIMSTGSEGWIRRAGGFERLLELRGPWRHQSLEERQIFEAARLMIVIKAITNCERTFLDQEAWLTLPWAQDIDQKSSMQHLIDMFCIIPGLLEDSKSLHFSKSFIWDLTTPTSSSIGSSFARQDPRSIDLHQRTQQCYIKLQKWKENWDRTYPSAVQPVNIPHPSRYALKFPIDIFEYALTFPNFLRASEYQLYNTVIFFLSCLMLSVHRFPPDDGTTTPSVSDLLGQRWDAANNICRAMPYDLTFEEHAWSLRTCVLRFFGEDSPEGKWIKQVLRRIQDKWGL